MLKNWLSLSVLILILLLLANFFWPQDELFNSQLDLKRWPYSPLAHLKMAQIYFETGYQTEALKEYQKGQQTYQVFSFLDFNQTVAQQLAVTENLVYKPKELNKQIQVWEEVLQTKPYACDVLLKLAVLNYQLYQDEKAQNYWQQAFYLDPNNTKVLEMRNILKIRN